MASDTNIFSDLHPKYRSRVSVYCSSGVKSVVSSITCCYVSCPFLRKNLPVVVVVVVFEDCLRNRDIKAVIESKIFCLICELLKIEWGKKNKKNNLVTCGQNLLSHHWAKCCSKTPYILSSQNIHFKNLNVDEFWKFYFKARKFKVIRLS